MSKLKLRKRKFPPPFDDEATRKTTTQDITTPPIATKDKRIFQRAISSAQKHGINLENLAEKMQVMETAAMRQLYSTSMTEVALLRNSR